MTLPVCPEPPALAQRSGPALPPGSCDAHAHLFAGAEEFARDPARAFEPAPGSFEHYLDRYRDMHAALGIERGVLVHSNVYGADNAVTLSALSHLGPGYRGVALVEDGATVDTLRDLRDGGMRAVRMNLIAPAGFTLTGLEAMAPALVEVGMHVETILRAPETLLEVGERLAALPVPVVIDHAARFDPREGTEAPGFSSLLRLLETGRTWTKLSGLYRTSGDPGLETMRPGVRAILKANPDRVVWGSDWPFVQHDGPMPDAGRLLDFVLDCADGEDTVRRVMHDNAARLYGFD